MPFDEEWRKNFEKSSDRRFSQRPEWMYYILEEVRIFFL